MGFNNMKIYPKLLHCLRHPTALLPGAPRGIIRDIDGWLINRQHGDPVLLRQGPQHVKWPDRGEEIRTLPSARAAHPKFPFESIPWRLLVTSPTALYRLKKARIIGREGTVISPDNCIIEAFTYTDTEDNLASHSIFRRRRFPKPKALRGTYATITYPSSFAWYHWVTESLPRLRLLQPWLDAIDGLFIPADTEPQLQQSLEAMGVRQDQLITLEIGDHFEPEYLLVPRYCAGLNLPTWVPLYLQDSIGLTSKDYSAPQRKLYISRSDAGKRRIVNESEMLPLLKRAGFEIICLRNFSFLEQARMFHEAAWVIAPHGAGLVNVLWSQPGVQVLELSPSVNDSPGLFHSITSCAGGIYWWLPGASRGPENAPTIHQDFEIDLSRFAEALLHTGADQ